MLCEFWGVGCEKACVCGVDGNCYISTRRITVYFSVCACDVAVCCGWKLAWVRLPDPMIVAFWLFGCVLPLLLVLCLPRVVFEMPRKFVKQ